VKRFGWFAVAGSVGFVADAGMLALLLAYMPIGPFAARVIAILFALSITWVFNRAITFGRSRHPVLLEGARYGGIGFLSAVLNYLVYAAVLLALPWVHPLAAVVAASLAAMAFSWMGYSRFVFQK
jgi:putative flippase GtrA